MDRRNAASDPCTLLVPSPLPPWASRFSVLRDFVDTRSLSARDEVRLVLELDKSHTVRHTVSRQCYPPSQISTENSVGNLERSLEIPIFWSSPEPSDVDRRAAVLVLNGRA